MLNRWQGNTGRRVIIEEAGDRPHDAPKYSASPESPPMQSAAPQRNAPFSLFRSAPLSSLLPQSIGSMETEDVILLLILYLMYRESGDSELLMILGGMFLL